MTVLLISTVPSYSLDRALIRPGRVDFQQKIDYASQYQLEKMYSRFYPEESEEKSREFAEMAIEINPEISMAQLQGLFLRHKHSPKNIHLDKNLLLKVNAGPRRHNV